MTRLQPATTRSTLASSQASLVLFFIDAQSMDVGPAARASFTLEPEPSPAVSAESQLFADAGPCRQQSKALWAGAANGADALLAEVAERDDGGAQVQSSARVQSGSGGFSLDAKACASGSPCTPRATSALAQATPSPLGLRVLLSPRSVLTVHARAEVWAQAQAPAEQRDERAHASAELYIAGGHGGAGSRSAADVLQARASSGGAWVEQGWTGPCPQASEARTLTARFANPADTEVTLWIVTGVSAEASSAVCRQAPAPVAQAQPA